MLWTKVQLVSGVSLFSQIATENKATDYKEDPLGQLIL